MTACSSMRGIENDGEPLPSTTSAGADARAGGRSGGDGVLRESEAQQEWDHHDKALEKNEGVMLMLWARHKSL